LIYSLIDINQTSYRAGYYYSADEDPLTEQDIITQDAALAQMDEQMGPIDIEMDSDI
jgi:hypothetical protein